MNEETKKKQGIVGLRVIKFDSRKAKDTEKIRIVLEADIDNLGFGSKSLGDFLGALEHHKSSDTDVGFSLFMDNPDEDEQ